MDNKNEQELKDKVFDEISEAVHTKRVAAATERIHKLYKQANYVHRLP